MSATATFGYLNAESNPTRVAFAAQIAGGALVAGVAWLDAYLRPPVSGITFNRLLRRTRDPGEDVDQLVVEIRSELDKTYRPIPTWLPFAIATASTAVSVYAFASDDTTKSDLSLFAVGSALGLEYGLISTLHLRTGTTQRQAFERAIDGIVVAPLPSAPPSTSTSPANPAAWNGAGVFMHGHF